MSIINPISKRKKTTTETNTTASSSNTSNKLPANVTEDIFASTYWSVGAAVYNPEVIPLKLSITTSGPGSNLIKPIQLYILVPPNDWSPISPAEVPSNMPLGQVFRMECPDGATRVRAISASGEVKECNIYYSKVVTPSGGSSGGGSSGGGSSGGGSSGGGSSGGGSSGGSSGGEGSGSGTIPGMPTIPTPQSRAQAILYNLCTNANNLAGATDTSCRILFDDIEHDIKNVNFATIYGLADAFTEYGPYNVDTEEKTEDLTYTTVRGYMYGSLKNMESGKTLDDPISDLIAGITEVCEKYQELYDKYVPPESTVTDGTGDETQKTKIDHFWDENISAFQSEIEPYWGALGAIHGDFSAFSDNVEKYKTLGTETLQIISCASNFLNEKRLIGTEADKTMLDVHMSSGKSYGNYSEDLGMVYDHWEKIRDYVPKIDADDEYKVEEKKRYYLNSEILSSLDFYNQAKTLHDWFSGFASKYELLK